MRAQLIPIDGGQPIEIVKEMTLVGRKEDCDLRLDHKSVSKMHCVLVKTDGLLLLRDLGSTNGTRVNGQRVRRAALLPNDQITIANFKFRLQLGPDQAARIEKPPPRLHEHTQALNAHEVAQLMQPMKDAADGMDSEDIPVHELMQRNALPDVYPDDQQAEQR